MTISKIFAGAVIALASCAATANEQWILVTESTSGTQFFIQAGSLAVGQNDGGVRVVYATGRTMTADKKITAAMWYVPVTHCINQRGKFAVTDTTGKFVSDHDFVFGLGSIAARIAETMCTVALGSGSKSPPATTPAPNSMI